VLLFGQATVETLAASAGVPVWNGLTDEWHPTQALCDAMTMRDWRIKPQMVPKRASTRSAVMIMTIIQAVRRFVIGGASS
jgi:ornithine carbamoyltransferase